LSRIASIKSRPALREAAGDIRWLDFLITS